MVRWISAAPRGRRVGRFRQQLSTVRDGQGICRVGGTAPDMGEVYEGG